MKYVKLKKYNFNLQFFTDGDTGDQANVGDDTKADEKGEGGEGGEGGENEEQDEKVFSQKDVDDAVKDKLAKEKRKWVREQAKVSPNPATKLDGKDQKDTKTEENDENQKLKEKAEELELKWVCLEHGVGVSNVDDVLALSRVYLAKDKDLDIEDAIDNVLKKYPSFKSEESGDEGTEKKGWGHRPGKTTKKETTVEDAIRNQLFGK